MIWAPDDDLPPAYRGCTCHCHRQRGCLHFVACCSPTVFGYRETILDCRTVSENTGFDQPSAKPVLLGDTE